MSLRRAIVVVSWALSIMLTTASCGGSASPSDSCRDASALHVALPRLVAHVGETLPVTVTGASGTYALTLPVNNTGATHTQLAYTAGATTGVDTLRVEDTLCGEMVDVELTVVPLFDVSPREATVRPATSFALSVVGAIGETRVTLLANGSGATLDGRTYTAGAGEGVDVIEVVDATTAESATLTFTVDAAAQLTVAPTRVALPAASSVPLALTHGSGHVSWMVEGSGAVVAGRFVVPGDAHGRTTLHGTDDFTGETVIVEAYVLEEPDTPPASNEALGTSIAAGRHAMGDPVLSLGAPGFTGGSGRVHVARVADATTSTPLVGADAPLHRGRGVGASVSYGDFNGDGREDLVVGATGLVTPALSDAQALDAYASPPTACFDEAESTKGGVIIALAQANGSYADAFRLLPPRLVAGCAPDTDTRCHRVGSGMHVAAGFDANGDGMQDVAAAFTHGVDVFLGRAPSDSSLAKLTAACAPSATYTVPAGSARGVYALGDLDGDGCHELALTYDSGERAGVVIAFGFDTGGSRCGGRTVPLRVRIAEDADVGTTYRGLGTAVARLGSSLAIGIEHATIDGMDVPGVVLVSVASINAARPASGEALRGLTQHALTVGTLGVAGSSSFGEALLAAEITGDGVPDLVVGAPRDPLAGPLAGAAYVIEGGGAFTSSSFVVPWLVLAGDDDDAGSFGSVLAERSVGGARVLALGAPTSERSAPASGAAFYWSGAF